MKKKVTQAFRTLQKIIEGRGTLAGRISRHARQLHRDERTLLLSTRRS